MISKLLVFLLIYIGPLIKSDSQPACKTINSGLSSQNPPVNKFNGIPLKVDKSLCGSCGCDKNFRCIEEITPQKNLTRVFTTQVESDKKSGYYTSADWLSITGNKLTEEEEKIQSLFKSVPWDQIAPPRDEYCLKPSSKTLYETKIFNDLFMDDSATEFDLSKYNKNLIPLDSDNGKEKVDVSTQIYLMDIIDYNTEEQAMELTFWLELKWVDFRLRWNPEDYGYVTNIIINPSIIWNPDLTLYNSVDSNTRVAETVEESVNLRVWSNGEVRWIPTVNFKASCPLSVAKFPFDFQTCYMKMGSWSYGYDQISFHLKTASTDQTHYAKDYTWKIKGDFAVSNLKKYTASPLIWQDMKFIYIFSRNHGQYVLNIVITCICLSIVTLLSFMVPPSAGERLSAQLAVVIAISVYQMIAMEELPKGPDKLPIMSWFIAVQLYVACFSIGVTMVIQRYADRIDKPKAWMKRLFIDVLRYDKKHGVIWLYFEKWLIKFGILAEDIKKPSEKTVSMKRRTINFRNASAIVMAQEKAKTPQNDSSDSQDKIIEGIDTIEEKNRDLDGEDRVNNINWIAITRGINSIGLYLALIGVIVSCIFVAEAAFSGDQKLEYHFNKIFKNGDDSLVWQ